MTVDIAEVSVGELAALSQLQAWANDPATQAAVPRQPQLVEPEREGTAQRRVLEAQLEKNLEIVRCLIGSADADLQLAAALLFDPIIAAGGQEQLKHVCMESPGQRVWDAFVRAAQLYVEYELAMAQPASIGGAPQSVGTLITVIVHGTLAAGNDWWREVPLQQNFWQYIEGLTQNCVPKGREFKWSGGLTDGDRRQGANLFLNWWQQEQQPELRVIAHSHGANVVWFAAFLEPKVKIKTFISLGTPICINYPLRLGQIQHLRNVYSEHDRIQIPGAALTGRRGEGRTLPDSAQIANYHVPYWDPKAWGVRSVGHSDLHEEQVWSDNDLDAIL